jgi:hypothetical protein
MNAGYGSGLKDAEVQFLLSTPGTDNNHINLSPTNIIGSIKLWLAKLNRFWLRLHNTEWQHKYVPFKLLLCLIRHHAMNSHTELEVRLQAFIASDWMQASNQLQVPVALCPGMS